MSAIKEALWQCSACNVLVHPAEQLPRWNDARLPLCANCFAEKGRRRERLRAAKPKRA